MPEPNHICIICGSHYYCCESRERLKVGSWLATCCSSECWNKYCDIVQARLDAQKNNQTSDVSEEQPAKRIRRSKTKTN